MNPPHDEFQLTDSAYRHGFDDDDVADLLRGRPLVIRSRRGKLWGYEFFGRNRAGVYLLAAGRVVKSDGVKLLRIFHVNRMTDAEHRRFLRQGRNG